MSRDLLVRFCRHFHFDLRVFSFRPKGEICSSDRASKPASITGCKERISPSGRNDKMGGFGGQKLPKNPTLQFLNLFYTKIYNDCYHFLQFLTGAGVRVRTLSFLPHPIRVGSDGIRLGAGYPAPAASSETRSSENERYGYLGLSCPYPYLMRSQNEIHARCFAVCATASSASPNLQP
jgi:hypothetical protein